MPVIDQGIAIGVVTRNGLGETLEHEGPHTPVGLVALSDVVVVEPNANLAEVLAELEHHPGAIALVLDQGSPLGMVTREQLDAFIDARAA